MENTTINELNAFLKGNYMAVHGYERFIQHIDNQHTKDVLQEIQKNHKQHAAQVAERIQNLGGRPIDDIGITGKVAEIVNNIKGTNNDTELIIKDAMESEDKGIQMAEEIVKGDLDSESLKLIEKILDQDRKHVKLLDKMVQ